MTAQLAPLPVQKFFDNNGNPLANGQLFTYVAGTTTPQVTYTDSTQATPNTNPVILNARGECNLWLSTALTYKLVLEDAFGNTIWTVDQIVGGFSVTQQSLAQIIFPQSPAEATAGVTPVNYQYQPFDIRRYGADPTGALPSDTAFASAVTVCGTTGGTIRAPAGTYSFANVTTALSLKNGIVIQGDGPASSGTLPGTKFQFTGTSSAAWFAFNGSQGVQFRGIQFVHSTTGFTGTYFQCNQSGGTVPSMCGLFDCTIGTSTSAVNHLNINNCQNFTVERCSFQYFPASGSVLGAGAGGFANNIAFRDCLWFNGAGAPIQNSGPHQAWNFEHCDFEGLSQAPSNPAGAILSAASTGGWNGLVVKGCWLGDAGLLGVWFDGYFQASIFEGNYISTGNTAFNLRQSVGVSIISNSFNVIVNGINFIVANCADVIVKANIANTVTHPWVNSANCTVGTLDWGPNFGFGNPAGHGSLNQTGYRVATDGSIEQWGLSSVAVASGTVTPFPISFPTGCFNVIATLSSVGSTANTIYVSSLTTTGFTYTIGGTFTNPTTFYWRAVGN